MSQSRAMSSSPLAFFCLSAAAWRALTKDSKSPPAAALPALSVKPKWDMRGANCPEGTLC